jgi:hypothetical protein
LTSEEWDAAIKTPGVQTAGDLLEWVESPPSDDAKTKTVRQPGKAVTRPDQAQPDVTFRMAKPPPGN